MNKRHIILISAAALTLILAAWSHSRMNDNRHAAQNAFENLGVCRDISVKISELNSKPALALTAEQEKRSTETIALIENAARSAGISADVITRGRISPQEKQRIEKSSSYKKQPTRVSFKNVTTEQLIRMLYELAAGENPLKAESIYLTSPDINDYSDTWNVEIVLVYLIYEPQEQEL